MKPILFVILTLILVIGAACSPEAPVVDPAVLETVGAVTQLVPSEATVPASTETALPMATSTQAPVAAETATTTPGASPQPDLVGLPQVEQAKADLATRLGVASEEIEVVAVEPVKWPDVSLGCARFAPSEGQQFVEGFVIQLAYDGVLYEYHSGIVEQPVACDQQDRKTTPPISRDNILTPSVGP